jgi:lipoate-protein ligase A
MAADEVMLEAAVGGRASVRYYRWEPPTLSIGYFQRQADRLQDACLAALPWVRRPTGGGAIVHDNDLTYALALPAALRHGRTPAEWHCRIHHILAELLQERQIDAEVLVGSRLPPGDLGFLCFAVPQPGDVVLTERKIIGGAQRLRAGALLQHGSIRLAGLSDQAESLAQGFVAALGWQCLPEGWRPSELARVEELADLKYRSSVWNLRR